MNTSAALFTDNDMLSLVDRQRAELYMRLYKYAAEDFTSHPDIKAFIKDLLRWAASIEEKLTKTHSAISSHVHNVPPHTHPIPPHTHMDSKGGPTSPNILGYLTSPVPLVTSISGSQQSMSWPTGKIPNPYLNTTGAIENITGNMIVVGTPLEGDIITGTERRAATISILLKPTIPPYLKAKVI